jgi:hypothetical protein
VQIAGAKDWLLGECLLGGTGVPARAVTTGAGDILLLPKNLPHLVTTPADPGALGAPGVRHRPRRARRGRCQRCRGHPARAGAMTRAIRPACPTLYQLHGAADGMMDVTACTTSTPQVPGFLARRTSPNCCATPS